MLRMLLNVRMPLVDLLRRLVVWPEVPLMTVMKIEIPAPGICRSAVDSDCSCILVTFLRHP